MKNAVVLCVALSLAGCVEEAWPPPAYPAPTVVVARPAPAPLVAVPIPPPLQVWAQNYGPAALELAAWVRQHPYAAAKLFIWAGHHPDRAKELVLWAITSPMQGVDAFMAMHPGWPGLNVIMQEHRSAATSFLFWMRRFPQAAATLMNHSRGLELMGQNLQRGLY
jgi:hypothetical protein